MSRLLLVAALLCAFASLACAIRIQSETRAEADASIVAHSPRVPTRKEEPLEYELADRAALLFRAMDHDRDRKVNEEDVRQSAEQLETHLPGITPDEFVSFMQMADKDGDKALNREEFMQGLADGLEAAKTVPAEVQSQPEGVMLETDASVQRRFFGKLAKGAMGLVKKGLNFAKSKAGEVMRSVTGAVDTSQDGCVMCQFIVERAEANVKQSGVIPSMSGTAAFDAFLETDSDTPTLMTPIDPKAVAPSDEDDTTSLLEVQSEQLYFDQTAAGIIGSTRQSTRVQRQLERQKYNEIYRVVDITLDDVCEQGMPNSFYGYCKQIYKVQSDVVDGLRYQYRPSDICFRIGMCGKASYITKGIHSRYK